MPQENAGLATHPSGARFPEAPNPPTELSLATRNGNFQRYQPRQYIVKPCGIRAVNLGCSGSGWELG